MKIHEKRMKWNLDAIRRIGRREDAELGLGLPHGLGLEYTYGGDSRRGFQKRELEGVFVQRTVQKKVRIRILFQNLLHYRRSSELEPPGPADQANRHPRSEQLLLPLPPPPRFGTIQRLRNGNTIQRLKNGKSGRIWGS